MTTHLPETRESLWMLAASPVIWAAHFLLVYVTAAVWCAKFAQPGDSLGGVRTAIAVYTVLALAAIARRSAGAAGGATGTVAQSRRTTPTRPRTAIASSASRRFCSRG